MTASPVSLRDRLAHDRYDGIVVGAGANGLAAAITLAQAGWRVALVEAASSCRRRVPVGRIDAAGSSSTMSARRFIRSVSGRRFFGRCRWSSLVWNGCSPTRHLAHPLDGGRRAEVVMMERSLDATCAGFGVG